MIRILLTSGYPETVLQAVRRKWKVINIPDQQEALAFLKSSRELPEAASIGGVSNRQGPDPFGARWMLQEIHKMDPAMPVIISTHESSPRQIVDFIRQGAFDYVVEPSDPETPGSRDTYTQDFLFALTRAVAWRRMVRENQKLKEDLILQTKPAFIRGRSSAILRVMELIRKVAPTPATVLITGESGTGKELVARAIHALSPQRDQPFTAINCGAINEGLLASELFGHVKGAFTGAERDHPGLIAETGPGTLLLDEIGTIPPSFQVMLLRVLEQRTFRPVGGTGHREAKCRFLSAANCDVEDLAKQGKFREDLFYRLNVFHIHIPPLRDRREDIPILSDYFLQEAVRQFGKNVKGISPAAMELLEGFPWPGNVRQLRNAIERAVIISEEENLIPVDLDPHIRDASARSGLLSGQSGYEEAMRHYERGLIQSALAQADGNRSRAAELLKINRTTLNYRIQRLSIENDDRG
jgi:two-component system, NtrC family, response regulator